MKAMKSTITLILLLSITSYQAQEGLSKGVKDKVGTEVEKVQDEGAQLQEKWLSKLNEKDREMIMSKAAEMDPAEAKAYLSEMKKKYLGGKEDGAHIDGVQRGKPELDAKAQDDGYIDGQQRGKPGQDKGHSHDHDHGGHAHDHDHASGHHDHDKPRKRGHHKERMDSNKKRLAKARGSIEANQERIKQIRTRLDSRLASGEITQEQYAERMKRIDEISARIEKLELRRQANEQATQRVESAISK